MPKRVALYMRVSTDDQTVENQRLALRDAAAKNGWDIAAEYIDDGVSGGKTDRPALNKMLTHARRGNFDVVMCWHMDRLGRSLEHLLALLRELEREQVDIVFLMQSIDTTTPNGRLMFQIMGAFAEFERATIRERVRAGMDRVQAQEADPVKQAQRRQEGKKAVGRPRIPEHTKKAIERRLAAGEAIGKIAASLHTGFGTVARVRSEMRSRGHVFAD